MAGGVRPMTRCTRIPRCWASRRSGSPPPEPQLQNALRLTAPDWETAPLPAPELQTRDRTQLVVIAHENRGWWPRAGQRQDRDRKTARPPAAAQQLGSYASGTAPPAGPSTECAVPEMSRPGGTASGKRHKMARRA